jgi:hypothetical protein
MSVSDSKKKEKETINETNLDVKAPLKSIPVSNEIVLNIPEEPINRMQLDQIYLYKFSLMLAIQDIIAGIQPSGEFQAVWNHYIENAGDYIINHRKEDFSKDISYE